MEKLYFEYGDKEVAYLKSKCPRLSEAIDAVGHVYREVDPDLFSSLVRCIIGQQISTAAQITVCRRLDEELGEVTPQSVDGASLERIQSCGMTFKKAEFIKDLAHKVRSGEFNLEAVAEMDDEEAIQALSSLKGIGRWTAEMLLLFTLQRPDVFSYDDLGIQRGIRMVYHHRRVTREQFERYRRRFSPYGSVASLYFWAISHMDVPGYDKDYAPMTEAQRKAARKRYRAKRKAKQA